jgi:hypothetical protein
VVSEQRLDHLLNIQLQNAGRVTYLGDMIKTWLRRIVDLGLYLSFCFIVGSGLLIQFKLVPGSQGGRGLSVMGMGRHDWGELHFYVGLLFMAFVIVHLILSWGWLVRVAASKKLWPILLGIGLGLFLIAGIYFQPVERNVHGENEHTDH